MIKHKEEGMNRYSGASKGQSTVEYLVLVTAIIAVVLLFTVGRPGQPSVFQNKLTNTLETMADQMTNVANRLRSTL
jgi:hypothetical protein